MKTFGLLMLLSFSALGQSNYNAAYSDDSLETDCRAYCSCHYIRTGTPGGDPEYKTVNLRGSGDSRAEAYRDAENQCTDDYSGDIGTCDYSYLCNS